MVRILMMMRLGAFNAASHEDVSGVADPDPDPEPPIPREHKPKRVVPG